MAEKKRKGSALGEAPTKKSRKSAADTVATKPVAAKSVATESIGSVDVPMNGSVTKPDSVAATSKKSRKRAADFLSDDGADTAPEAVPEAVQDALVKPSKKGKASSAAQVDDVEGSVKKSKKGKKDKKEKVSSQTITADGINGVLERDGEEELEPVTAELKANTSMQAEAQHTVEKELEDEFASADVEETAVATNGDADEDEADQGAALLAGFDSDTEDVAQDTAFDPERLGAVPNYKKTQKKLQKAKSQGSDTPGAVYVGRIPHGFYEQQMREYFTQFGDISKLRLSRNKQTGASKHFAFIEFKSDEVAKIVAETMDNYLMFGHILKCKYAPVENLHPDVWKGANKRYRKIPHAKLERELLAAPKSDKYWQKKVENEQNKRDKVAAKMKKIGYEMPQSTLTNPADVIEQRRLEQQKESESIPQIEASEAGPAGAINPPPGVPKDDVALELSKKPKKSKKEKKAKTVDAAVEPLTEGNLEAKNAGLAEPVVPENNAVTSPAVAQDENAPVTTTAKKAKKAKGKSKGDIKDSLPPITMAETTPASQAGASDAADDAEPSSTVANLNGAVAGTADGELKKRTRSRKTSKKEDAPAVAPVAVPDKEDKIVTKAVKGKKVPAAAPVPIPDTEEKTVAKKAKNKKASAVVPELVPDTENKTSPKAAKKDKKEKKDKKQKRPSEDASEPQLKSILKKTKKA